LLTDLNYAGFLEKHVSSGASLTVASRSGKVPIPYGVLHVENGVVEGVEEKPDHEFTFNAGIYAVSPEALDFLPAEGRCDMTDLIAELLRGGKVVRSEELTGLWYDLAAVEDFDAALNELHRIGLKF
jgi:NDP-sugar pyrophosphorylase family protein